MVAISENTSHPEPHPQTNKARHMQRVVILGAGFGGLYTAYHLEKLFRHHAGIEITLVSRDNYFLMTPFLFEAGSGVLEPRHAVNPIRRMFTKTRFVEADVERVDFDARRIYATHSPGKHLYELDYDHIVLALGGVTNRKMIPGSGHALGFKTLSDGIFLRNRLIDLFEQADVEEDPERRRKLLTIVVIGGGLVGVELLGELTEFMHNLLRSYPRIPRSSVRYFLVEAHERILPEMEEDLARYAADVLWRRGVNLFTGTRVERIEPDRVHLPESDRRSRGGAQPTIIEADTILLAAGIAANPLLETFPLEKDKKGRIVVDAAMRSKQRPEVWALGDCASIPDSNGNPYPPLAQHALREAKVLARNIATVLRRGNADGSPPKLEPFVYHTLGMLAALGHYDGVGRIGPFKIRGFFAWWVWRTYYVMQMPRFERRLRIIIDWTIALLFRNDVVKLDLFGEEHPTRAGAPPDPHKEIEADLARQPAEVTAVDGGPRPKVADNH
jgi:NADH:ubiquinone reductase (H+-translocating)